MSARGNLSDDELANRGLTRGEWASKIADNIRSDTPGDVPSTDTSGSGGSRTSSSPEPDVSTTAAPSPGSGGLIGSGDSETDTSDDPVTTSTDTGLDEAINLGQADGATGGTDARGESVNVDQSEPAGSGEQLVVTTTNDADPADKATRNAVADAAASAAARGRNVVSAVVEATSEDVTRTDATSQPDPEPEPENDDVLERGGGGRRWTGPLNGLWSILTDQLGGTAIAAVAAVGVLLAVVAAGGGDE